MLACESVDVFATKKLQDPSQVSLCFLATNREINTKTAIQQAGDMLFSRQALGSSCA